MARVPRRHARYPLFLSSLLLSFPAMAAETEALEELSTLSRAISESEIAHAIETSSQEGLSGLHLSTLLAPSLPSEASACAAGEDPGKPRKKAKPKKGRTAMTEILFVAELGDSVENAIQELDRNSSFPVKHHQEMQALLLNKDLTGKRPLDSFGRPSLDGAQLLKWASTAEKSDGSALRQSDPKLLQKYFVEALYLNAAASNLPENELAAQIASAITAVGTTEEERYNLIANFSSRGYRNYNAARNPGANTSKNNPKNAPTPDGDMTLNQLVRAAAEFDPFSGGVCNDIAEQAGLIAQKVFPDKEVLVLTGGSHFGVLISDGKETRVIDSGKQFLMEDRLSLLPESQVPNARVNQIVNGKLKQIAVVDTQMGQILNSAYDLDRPDVRTDTKVSTVIARAKRVWEKTDEKRKTLAATAAAGKLSDSEVLVGVVKYESSTEISDFYTGAGVTAQQFSGNAKDAFQVHLKTGFDHALIQYRHPNASMKVSSGIHGDLSVGSGKSSTDGLMLNQVAGGVNLRQRAQWQTRSRTLSGWKTEGDVQVIHALGPKSWGDFQGAISTPERTGEALKKLGFHLNQVSVEASAEKPLSKNLSSRSEVAYQGTHIGQKIDLATGIEAKLPQGARIYYFIGYTDADIKGYSTTKSLLVGPSGAKTGVKVENRKGVSLDAGVQGVGSGRARVNSTLRVPIGTKKKK